MSLLQSSWDEDDSVCLVCRPSQQQHAAEWRDSSLYTLSDELQHYECFEYTTQPEPMTIEDVRRSGDDALMTAVLDQDHHDLLNAGRCVYVGKMLLRLPSYGGSFHLSYVRQSKPMICSTTKKLVRRRIALAQSTPIHIRAAVHTSHPDRPMDRRVALCFTTAPSHRMVSNDRSSLVGKTLRRRGVRVMSGSHSLQVVVEDMQQLRVLSVSASVPQSMVRDSTNTCILSRTMTWAYTIENTAHGSDRSASLCVVFEADLILRDNSCDDDRLPLASEVSTVYGLVEVQDLCGSFGSRDVSIAVGRGYNQLETNHRIVCRLPYSLPHDDDGSSFDSSAASSLRADFPVPPPTDSLIISVRCRFCDSVITGTEVGMLKPLPTGLLDNVSSSILT